MNDEESQFKERLSLVFVALLFWLSIKL